MNLQRKNWKKVGAILLAAVLMVGSIPMNTQAGEVEKPEDTTVISQFGQLDVEVATQNFTVGSEESPVLPEKLPATLTTTTWEAVAPETEENLGAGWNAVTEDSSLELGVEWKIEEGKNFSTDVAETYTYTASTDEYPVLDEVPMPTITVVVEDAVAPTTPSNTNEKAEEPAPTPVSDPGMLINTQATSYVDEIGASHSANATVLTSDTIDWNATNGGFYVATEDITINTRVTVTGDVKLILADDVTIEIPKGITVQDDDNNPATPSTNSLTIYGQTNGTGHLYAGRTATDEISQTTNYSAGIGGGHQGAGGTITISGGSVTATGGGSGAGIGGGNSGAGGDITINSGTVIAKGRSFGAGIGGGSSGAGGDITINSGTVIAKGERLGAGIGGGVLGAGGTITISGGNVTATGGSEGAGIGGGHYGAGGEITIKSGTVIAKGGSFGAGIGGGSSGAGGAIIISGGSVIAGGGGSGVGIGSGPGGELGTFTTTSSGNAFIMASSEIGYLYINATTDEDAWSGIIFKSNTGQQYGSQIVLTTDATLPEDYALTIGTDQTLVISEGVTLTNNGTITNNGSIVYSGTIKGTGTINGNTPTIPTGEGVYANYVDENGAIKPVSATELKVDSDIWNADANGGFYVATGDIKIDTRVEVTGDVKLILADGATLEIPEGITVQDDDNDLVTPSPNSLTIYGQIGGTGHLYAGRTADDETSKVANRYAGIGGGGYEGAGGSIEISGGNVIATGGRWAAGIGGGDEGAGGEITISGGSVVATGHTSEGAGIGGGSGESGGKITVSGGSVVATGESGGAGIGGGYGGAGGSITISEGSVTATGDYGGAGIGGGDSEAGGTIEISGGSVTATGGSYGAGIGGGNEGAGGSITISGGSVESTGRNEGAGIGGGYKGSGGEIEISGGSVTAIGNLGAGIGGGYKGSGGSFHTTDTGNTFIVASSISDLSKKDDWSGIIFYENYNGTVYTGNSASKSLALTTDATIPEGKKLVIPSGVKLVLAADVELTNAGTLYISDMTSIEGTGVLLGEGIFTISPTDGNITIPEQYYTGQALVPQYTLAAGIQTVLGKTFNVNTDSENYTPSYTNNTNVGNGTLSLTDAITQKVAEKQFTISQSGMEATGGIKTYKDESETGTFTYGDTITIKLTPNVTGLAPITTRSILLNSLNSNTQQAKSIAIYYGDQMLTEAQTVVTFGEEMTFDILTGGKGLAIGNNTLTARYTGDTNTANTDMTVDITLNAKQLTWATGGTARGKTYNGDEAATQETAPTLAGVLTEDTVTVSSGELTFADKNIGIDKAVTATGYGIEGDDAGNYVAPVEQPSFEAADITAIQLTWATDGVVSNKIYDGNTNVKIESQPTLGGVLQNENVTLVNGTVSFVNENVEVDKQLTVTGYGIEGGDVSNYLAPIVQPSFGTADITAKPLTWTSGTVEDKVYDGTLKATVVTAPTLEGIVEGDAVTIIEGLPTFAGKDKGESIAVTATGYGIAGADSGNYSLQSPQPSFVNANITAKELTWTTGSVDDKVYDGTTAVTIQTAPTLIGVVALDDITITVGTTQFETADSGEDIAVIASGYGIDGSDEDNYTLQTPQPSFESANITAKPLTLEMVSDISNQTYEGVAIEPSFTVTDGNKTLVKGRDYTVTFTNNTDAGRAEIVITGAGNYSGELTKAFTIEKAEYTATKTAEGRTVYGLRGSVDLSTWAALTDATFGEIRLTDAEGIIVQDSYKIEENQLMYTLVDDKEKAGESATLTIPVESKNYEDFDIVATITAADKKVSELSVEDIQVVFQNTALTAEAIKGTATYEGEVVTGSFAFAENQGLTNVADSGAKTVIFTPENTDEFETVSTTIQVTIEKAQPTGMATYRILTQQGETLERALLKGDAILGVDGKPLKGTITWDAGASTVAEANVAYGWTFVPDDAGNYTNLTGELTPYEVKADGTTPEIKEPTTEGTTTDVEIEVKPSTEDKESQVTIPKEYLEDAVEEAVKKAESEGTTPKVTIKVDTPEGATSLEVEIDSATLEELKDVEGGKFEIESEVGTLTFDQKAIESIVSKANGESISIVLRFTTTMTEEQVKAAEGFPVFELLIVVGDQLITDFDGGNVTVSVPYTLKANEAADSVTVYYIDENGKLTKHETTYDSKTQVATFTTTHFSLYVVKATAVTVPSTSGTGSVPNTSDANHPMKPIMATVLAMIGMSAVMVMSRRKKEN